MFGEREICALLDEEGVAYDFFHHEAVATCEAASMLNLPHAGVVATMNLLPRDGLCWGKRSGKKIFI